MAARNIYSIIKAAGAVEIGPIRTSVRDRPLGISRAQFTTSSRRSEEVRNQRYGTANQPPPHLKTEDGGKREGRSSTTDRPARPPVEEQKKLAAPLEEEEKASPTIEAPVDEVKVDIETLANDPAVAANPDPPPATAKAPTSRPLETVLNMPAPAEAAEENKPPHLTPPPYVHHFDTYSLVRSLTNSGFSDDQSTTVMKAVRTILAENMDLARRGLVSKSNVENETYLFRAACSELKTEIENNRKGELDKNRTRRALLQHEVDILNQRMTQESSNLKDDLKGMFDDRKMTVRMEQRNMENRIQELNYKITRELNSDARSEVESVRWVLTRRAGTALAFAAITILASLNYSRYMTATQEKERKKHEELMRASEAEKEMASLGTQTDDLGAVSGEALVASEGVSIG